MNFSVTSLGCKISQFDAGVLRDSLLAMGASIADGGEAADVQVINTCTVTAKSDYQCRQAVRRAVAKKPDGGLVVVTGCYARTNPGAIRDIPGVDLVVDDEASETLAGLLVKSRCLPESVPDGSLSLPSKILQARHTGRSRAFLKVQDGCDAYCSYCIVPFARGRSRSARPGEVIEKVDRLIESGYYEIVLTGVHLGAYGMDMGEGLRLSGLVEKILTRPGLGRLRLSSIEPMEFDEALLELAGSEKLCRHFHIPLQSGDDRVLASMGRGYGVGEYFEVIEKLARKAPGACLGADVIVGYPLEDDISFYETFRRIEDSAINYLHVFSYSPRPGTRAFALGDPVPGGTKKDRSARLRELALKKNLKFKEDFIGSEMTVVVENKDGSLTGLTDNYIRVRLDGNGVKQGSAISVRIERVEENVCEGVLSV